MHRRRPASLIVALLAVAMAGVASADGVGEPLQPAPNAPEAQAAPDPSDPYAAVRPLLRDQVTAEDRLRGIQEAIKIAGADREAEPLVALLSQRTPRRAFDQLISLMQVAGEAGETYRRREFIAPLARTVVSGDRRAREASAALQLFSGERRLANALTLLANEEETSISAGLELAETRPEGVSGVLKLVPKLIPLLESASESIRLRTHAVLSEITYLDLDSDPKTWQAAFLDKSEAELLTLLADAATKRVAKVDREFEELQTKYVQELQDRIRAVRDNPGDLVQYFNSPYTKVRRAAVERIRDLLPSMPPEQQANVVDTLAGRLAHGAEPEESVLLEIATTMAEVPAAARKHAASAIRNNGLPPAVKRELVRAISGAGAMSDLEPLLHFDTAVYNDVVQMALVRQMVAADPGGDAAALSRVAAKIGTRMQSSPPEDQLAAFSREVGMILETVRFIASNTSGDLTGLCPAMLAVAIREDLPGADENRLVTWTVFREMGVVRPNEVRGHLFSQSGVTSLVTLLSAYTPPRTPAAEESMVGLLNTLGRLGELPSAITQGLSQAWQAETTEPDVGTDRVAALLLELLTASTAVGDLGATLYRFTNTGERSMTTVIGRIAAVPQADRPAVGHAASVAAGDDYLAALRMLVASRTPDVNEPHAAELARRESEFSAALRMALDLGRDPETGLDDRAAKRIRAHIRPETAPLAVRRLLAATETLETDDAYRKVITKLLLEAAGQVDGVDSSKLDFEGEGFAPAIAELRNQLTAAGVLTPETTGQ